ncbi:lysophospholipid acyltransferase family protein [Polaromonas eurypsychrophila]|uniref:1-acyl-sn-glycerol-3-phosphate acyltransferase n=1 Tax=Polaromonas eurypsychrophila TaxID=1614635 RepID=A0A916S6E2_9BURK|nr:lysophospholipid acyltransferase family protein [Polaromonas eurypsychrophila]GGA85133.1 1-acyl-sn-glycerol-3-phosphate acyltransferase [Polaromonas eurypsychrophila]
MRQARAVWRLLWALSHIAGGIWTIVFRFPKLAQYEKEARVHAWAQAMLRGVGITLALQGRPVAAGPALLVANHLSWLDIVVLHASRYCRFVSKADIRHWPLVGTLAGGAGTLYIERESRRDAHRVVHHMVERLQLGEVLAVFPEGTTGDGIAMKPFHANLLQAAISANAPVQPVALRFVDADTGQTSFAPRYIDDDSIFVSIWETLCVTHLRAEVTVGEPQRADDRDRRAWAADLQAEVAGLLRERP